MFPVFKSFRSYRDFHYSVLNHNRLTRNQEQTEFLDAVLATSANRIEVIFKGFSVFRAQKGNAWEVVEIVPGQPENVRCPFEPERMKPSPQCARAGRAHPKGKAYLYVSTKAKTAVAEMRPWQGSFISMAELVTTRDLRILNCTGEKMRPAIYLREPDPAKRELEVWKDIDEAFALPLTTDDDEVEYAPTQILAETFQACGLDGVAYRSLLSDGQNMALFDLDSASIVNRSLKEIISVRYEHRVVRV